MKIPRYQLIHEVIPICNDSYMCSYKPCYGLVKYNDMIQKIDAHMGTYFYTGWNDKTEICVQYFRENCIGYTGQNELVGAILNEDEICELLHESK